MRGRHGANLLWADEHTKFLISLVGKISFSKAAAEINARFSTSYSRNAAIGKASRLGLVTPAPKRDPQDIAATRRARQNRSNARNMERRREAGIPAAAPRAPRAPRPIEPALRCVVVEPLHVSLLELEDHCRWPYGDNPPFTFCGHPQFGSSSYCGAHFFLSIGRGTGSERAAHKVAKNKLIGAWG